MVPSLGAAISVGASVLASAITSAPRGIFYALGINTSLDWIYMLFWPVFIFTALYVTFKRKSKIRSVLTIASAILAISNVGGCMSEAYHQIS